MCLCIKQLNSIALNNNIILPISLRISCFFTRVARDHRERSRPKVIFVVMFDKYLLRFSKIEATLGYDLFCCIIVVKKKGLFFV